VKVKLLAATLLPLLLVTNLPGADRPHKIGLALSGGGARGAAHIGVLKVLEKEGIRVDCIAGTSFGSLVGGLYALGYSAAQIEEIFTRQEWDRIFSDAPDRRLSPMLERKNFRYQGQLAFQGFSPELPTGLWSGQKLTEVLNKLTTERMLAARYDFDRLPIPFRTVATDLLTGKSYIFHDGPMTEALRASVAIPMLFTPVEKGDMLLVDGGLTDNLPTDIVRSMGADFVIAVDVSSPLLKKKGIRTFLDVMDQSLSLVMRQSVESNSKLADILIRPELDEFTYSDYNRVSSILERGEREAQRHVEDLKIVAGTAAERAPDASNQSIPAPIVADISFQGLHNVPSRQLRNDIRTRKGEKLTADVLEKDLSRLYATRLFDRVDCNLEPVEDDKYRLNFVLKESPLNTLGASIRYDSDYKFVALAEITARQLFNSYSSATLSTQFGGIENHSAALRFVAPALPFLYIEPKVHVRRRERLDFRDGNLVDQYTDRRIGGQLMLGGTFLRRLQVEAGYRADSVDIRGGTFPNVQPDARLLAGLTMRLTRDTLDEQEYAANGMLMRFQVDRRSTMLGGDVDFWKWQIDLDRFVALTGKSTLIFRAAAGYSEGDIPFYDRFYLGGFNFSEGASRQFLGYERDELLARQMGLAAVGFRRELFARPVSFAKRVFLTGFYNASAISQRESSPYEFALYHGVGVGLAIDTVLGPARLTGAWGESGRFNFSLSLGPGF
jgi:NTE family protein